MMDNPVRILIVDDEEKILARLSKLLEKEGYYVETAGNGDIAIEKLKNPFDIILTDLNMPGKSGFDLIEHLKNSNVDALPIILTGYASVDGAIKAIKLGAYDFIEKPIDSATLRLIIQRASERILLQRENIKNLVELQKLNQLKNEFLSVVSHDLRSPLSTIGGYINFLLKKGGLTELQEKYLQIIKDMTQNLYTLVNELLDVSKIEAGTIQLNKEYIDITELINTSMNNFILLAVDKNNTLKFYNRLSEPFILIDRMKIIQVMNNLVNNAIKFTENGHITVEATDRDSDIIITISDTGMGIEKNEIEMLFKTYSYFHREGTRGEIGTGLGLIICKRFIELHGGEITVTSNPGTGSIFEFSLPRGLE